MNSISKIGVTLAENNCPTIELLVTPVEPSAHEHPVLHITGILPSNIAWDTWIWQVAGRFDINGDEVLTPIWLDAQTGGLKFNAMGDDNIVRVKLQIGNCIYYSNESGYECPSCCDRVWMTLIDQVGSPLLFTDLGTTVGIIWQRYDSPIWTDVQTGGSSLTSYDDGALYRAKYIDTKGCIHYTNIDTNTTYTFAIIGNNLIITPSTGTPQSLPLPTGTGGDDWGTQVIQHAPGSVSSGDGTLSSPLLVENCKPINLEITEVNGPGTTSHLDIEGILPTDPAWNTWEWQVNLNWVFNADNSAWTTAQTGGLDFTVGTDDTSVRVKFTIGNCIYYSNVSGMYDHPSYDCPTIELFVTPAQPDASETPVLHVTGILPSNPAWDAWVWEQANRYDGLGGNNQNPVWSTIQTGGTILTAMGDDKIVRVRLQIDNCIYYSNETGYEKPTPCGNVRLEAFNYGWGFEIFPIIENDVPGVGTNGHPNYSPNSFVFQRLGGVPPNFTFTDVQTGEDPVGLRLLYSSTTEDYYRIKYTSPSTGCIYYSNIVGVIFP